MNLINRSCPICNGTIHTIYLTCIDHTFSKEKFDLVQCTNCHFIYTNPVPDITTIGKYYKSKEYISHNNTNKGLINKLYQIVRKQTLKNKIKLLNRLNRNQRGNLLDIGCGTGHFIEAAKKDGWQIQGTEPDTEARRLATKISGTEIKENIFAIENKSFDIITLWHVLEHVHELNDKLNTIRELLLPNGFILIAVPNCESLDAKKYKEYWAAYDVPRHLYHFTKKTMSNLLTNHKLKIVEIIPMPFDSFYVSMMSEKYKGKNPYLIGLFTAFLTGIRSNQNSNNTSSLLYIVKKNESI